MRQDLMILVERNGLYLTQKPQQPVKGMFFADSDELKHCITNYSIAQGSEIKFAKMSKKVVRRNVDGDYMLLTTNFRMCPNKIFESKA